MSPAKPSPPVTLHRVLFRLLSLRFFLPLISLTFLFLCLTAYFSDQSLKQHQAQLSRSTAQLVDQYIDQGIRQLDFIARLIPAEPDQRELTHFIHENQLAFGMFETIYYLDDSNAIRLIVPPDDRYLGLDMSNLPYFDEMDSTRKPALSRPFISLRTGEPTVYLSTPLAEGRLIGALSLNGVQRHVAHLNETTADSTIFVLDHSGMLLAHPDTQLVKEQTNISNLDIFRRGLQTDTTLIYRDRGVLLLASSARTPLTDWLIICQTPLALSWQPYLWIWAAALALSLLLWLALWRNLNRSLHQNIIQPVETLSHSTAALASGNYQAVEQIAAASFFSELNQLSVDFLKMSRSLQLEHDQLEEKVELRTQELTALNEELLATNQELSDALSRLQQAQEYLVRSEKRAALGSLVVGIAHEVNTPIGTAITISSHLQELLAVTRSRYETKTMTRHDFMLFLDESREAFVLLLTSLQKAAQLIRSFKQVSVDQSAEQRQHFFVAAQLDAVIAGLRSSLPAFAHSVEVDCAPDLEMNSYPGAFAHIVRSLMLNSHLHGYDSVSDGPIELTARSNDGEIILTCRDYGQGIAPEIRERIFDPFFTTRRGSGSIGLDLYVVYNIVTQQLSGRIECESTLGQGTTFTVTIPSC